MDVAVDAADARRPQAWWANPARCSRESEVYLELGEGRATVTFSGSWKELLGVAEDLVAALREISPSPVQS